MAISLEKGIHDVWNPIKCFIFFLRNMSDSEYMTFETLKDNQNLINQRNPLKLIAYWVIFHAFLSSAVVVFSKLTF